MAWIDKSKGWLKEPAPRATPPAVPPSDLLADLLPDALKEKGSFNTWDVSLICGVTKKTVERWIREALLGTVRLPGGKSRVTKGQLREFLLKYNSLSNGHPPEK